MTSLEHNVKVCYNMLIQKQSNYTAAEVCVYVCVCSLLCLFGLLVFVLFCFFLVAIWFLVGKMQ